MRPAQRRGKALRRSGQTACRDFSYGVFRSSGRNNAPALVEPQSPYIEHPELIAQRIGRYAGLLGAERVMLGGDCGFSVHAGSNNLDPEEVWAKLAALSEGAEIARRRH